MKNLSKKMTALTVLLLAFNVSLWAQKTDLTINVSGFKSNKGIALIYVFNSKKGFPSEEALKVVKCKINGGKCMTTLTELSLGEYAISVLHDENSNNKIDTNFFGIPKEGTGVSNNPNNDGPPLYSDAKFSLVAKSKPINIIINNL